MPPQCLVHVFYQIKRNRLHISDIKTGQGSSPLWITIAGDMPDAIPLDWVMLKRVKSAGNAFSTDLAFVAYVSDPINVTLAELEQWLASYDEEAPQAAQGWSVQYNSTNQEHYLYGWDETAHVLDVSYYVVPRVLH